MIPDKQPAGAAATPSGCWILIPAATLVLTTILVLAGEPDTRHWWMVAGALLPWLVWVSCVLQSAQRIVVARHLLGSVVTGLSSMLILNRLAFFLNLDITSAMQLAIQTGGVLAFATTALIDLCLSLNDRPSA